METYELICYALAPELSPEEAQTRARAILEDVPTPRPGVRLALLPLEAARRAQRELTRAGIVCNYRPAPPKLDLHLAEPEHNLECPGCGLAFAVPEKRRNCRCPRCRRPVLRHGRQVPPPTAPSPSPSVREAPPSRAVATLLTLSLILLCAGTVQPRTLSAEERDIWKRTVAPLAREFHFLTQAMALARHRPATVATTATQFAETVATRPQAPSVPPPDANDTPGASANAAPAAPEPTADPASVDSLPRLPEAIRDSRSLNELHAALLTEIEDHPEPSSPRPAEFPGPPRTGPLPAIPALDVPAPRLQAAVAALDAHLARKAPFLRRLYARDLEQLAQLRKLTAVTQVPRRPASERTAARSIPTENPHTPVTPTKTPGFCPVWRKPAPLLCPA